MCDKWEKQYTFLARGHKQDDARDKSWIWKSKIIVSLPH